MTKRYNQVHAVCQYLRKDLECKGCLAWEDSDYGKVRRGCYGMAKEVINIVKYGNPWGKHAPRNKASEWRKRVARRTQAKPKLRVVGTDRTQS